MKKIQHFVLTRFNIPFIHKNNIDFLFSESYLNERYSIFEKTCYSSMCNQTNKNFIWLVLFDKRTPESFIYRNEQLHKVCKNFIPIYIDMSYVTGLPIESFYVMCANEVSPVDENDYGIMVSKIWLPEFYNSLIRSYCEYSTEYVITTRIDNDDCFEYDMVEYVQKYATIDRVDTILSFDMGVQYFNNTYIAQYFYYPNNHFTSMLEKLDKPLRTVFYWDHFFVEEFMPVFHISEKPLWLEILHNSNAINTIKLNSKNSLCLFGFDLNPFGICLKYSSIKVLASLLINPGLYLYPWVKYVLHFAIIKKYLKKL